MNRHVVAGALTSFNVDRLLDDGGITDEQYKSLSNEEKLALIARILYETSTVVESLADELRDGE